LEVKQKPKSEGVTQHLEVARVDTTNSPVEVPVALQTTARIGLAGRRNTWALDSQEDTSAPQETIASTNAKKTTLRKRGMLA